MCSLAHSIKRSGVAGRRVAIGHRGAGAPGRETSGPRLSFVANTAQVLQLMASTASLCPEGEVTPITNSEVAASSKILPVASPSHQPQLLQA